MNRVLLVLAAMLIAFGARAQTTNGLPEAEVEGRQLAQQLLEESPVTNIMQTGTLTTKPVKGAPTDVPFAFASYVLAPGYWVSKYVAEPMNSLEAVQLEIVQTNRESNKYILCTYDRRETDILPNTVLNDTQIIAPFAGSGFWICDLGLEFFHWPDQKILKHESRRTRECAVLESTNPNPSPGAYSRVDSWIDNETLGIVHADAYDSNGKLLKVFDPKSFKKVNGQWELQDMEIRNVQTRSRTWIKFDLK